MVKSNFLTKIIITLWLNQSLLIGAIEQHISGLVDLRLVATDSFKSYINGGYGKFRYSDGETFSLAQMAFNYRLEWENNLSFHLVTNAYGDGVNDKMGITESYFKYKTIPTESGFRYQFRGGFMYPKISLENNATGWSSPYTLSYSTMNSWIGEEVRHLGLEASVTKLGKFSESPHDFSLTASIFNSNDTSGTMLSWHGWTQSSRQSFWNELIDIPFVPAFAPGQPLQTQSLRSDPFREIDSNIGYHIAGQWKWHKKMQLSAGYYDNKGGVDVVEDGQYVWITKFSHLGLKSNLADGWSVIFQYMTGDTRMSVADDFDVVAVNFDNSFILVTKKSQQHRYSVRIEKFSIDDVDTLAVDNNDENGNAMTLNYTYQMNKNLFINVEYNWIDSERPSRVYQSLDVDAVEKQTQIGLRYYF